MARISRVTGFQREECDSGDYRGEKAENIERTGAKQSGRVNTSREKKRSKVPPGSAKFEVPIGNSEENKEVESSEREDVEIRYRSNKNGKTSARKSESEEEVTTKSPDSSERTTKSRRPLGPGHANSLLLRLEKLKIVDEECAGATTASDQENDALPSKSKEKYLLPKTGFGRRETPRRAAKRVESYKQPRAPIVEESQSEHATDEEFDSLDDFIVGDDESVSYFEDSDNGVVSSEDEEDVVFTKPRSPRKLFRGLRPRTSDNRDNTPEHPGESVDAESLSPDPCSSIENTLPLIELKPMETPESDQATPEKKTRTVDMVPGLDGCFDSKSPPPDSKDAPPKMDAGIPGFITPPTSPSKPRLQSPSKTGNRIPPSPHRPNLEEFWSQEVINDWNDQYSPRKKHTSRRLLRHLESSSDEDESGNNSPTSTPERKPSKSPTKSSPSKSSAAATKRELAAKKREFDEAKGALADHFIRELDDVVTNGEIQKLAASTGGLRIVWNKKLNTTAGRPNWKRETLRRKVSGSQQQASSSFAREGHNPRQGVNSPSDDPFSTTVSKPAPTSTRPPVRHHASIELAEKVIDSEDRLINTLAHEYCHLANFMISNVRDQPHGASFKAWAAKCMKALASHPRYGGGRIEITTKHSYAINYKYLWCCECCGSEYGRHSKSIDPKKSRCGLCKGVLVQVRPKPRRVAGKKEGAGVEGKIEKVTVSMGSVVLE